MKRLRAVGGLTFLIVITLLLLVVGLPASNLISELALSPETLSSPAGPERLADLEEQILKSTVRVYYQTWTVADDESGFHGSNSVGYATVKDGRYLVTHNHTNIPLSIRDREGDAQVFTQIWLYDAAGEIRYKGSLTEFSIVFDDTETLVLGHREEGFLEKLGFESADFVSWDQLGLESGVDVAQIDWDGERASVDWVTVREVTTESGVPRMSLDNGLLVGASGGGVFLNGYHIANNWRVEQRLDGLGNVVGQISTAALNAPWVAG